MSSNKNKKDGGAVTGQGARGRPPKLCPCVCGCEGRYYRGEIGWYVRCVRDPGFSSATEHSTLKRAATAWADTQEKMDKLARDAVCAYHTGQSYGSYIAGIHEKKRRGI